MLQIRDLSFQYPSGTVLNSVSFDAVPGEITALIGLNGSGKTTLIKSVLGLLTPSSGTVTADGRLLFSENRTRFRPSFSVSGRERARLLSYVPQRTDGGFSFSAEEFAAMGASAYLGAFSRPDGAILEHARALLTELGVPHLIGRNLSRMSGGENRMAYLARAILQNARYSLMDEPVASLDLRRQHEFMQRLSGYVRKSNTGVVFSIHDPQLAYEYAGHFLFMKAGHLIGDLRKEKENEGFRNAFTGYLREIYGEGLRTDFFGNRLVLGYTDIIH